MIQYLVDDYDKQIEEMEKEKKERQKKLRLKIIIEEVEEEVMPSQVFEEEKQPEEEISLDIENSQEIN